MFLYDKKDIMQMQIGTGCIPVLSLQFEAQKSYVHCYLFESMSSSKCNFCGWFQKGISYFLRQEILFYYTIYAAS